MEETNSKNKRLLDVYPGQRNADYHKIITILKNTDIAKETHFFSNSVLFILKLVLFRKLVTTVKNWAVPQQSVELPGTCPLGWMGVESPSHTKVTWSSRAHHCVHLGLVTTLGTCKLISETQPLCYSGLTH